MRFVASTTVLPAIAPNAGRFENVKPVSVHDDAVSWKSNITLVPPSVIADVDVSVAPVTFRPLI